MSKRRRAESPSSPTAKSSRIPTSSREIICQLPPTCHVKPTFLKNTRDLESHYATCHAHVCAEERCGSIFPEKRLLDLHHTECHDPIATIRKEKGDKIFSCFDTNCKSVFMTPKGRRLHLVDKHKYPPNYFFAVTNYGIGRLLMKWGEGVSLLRNEWRPRNEDDQDETRDNMDTVSEHDAGGKHDNHGKSKDHGYCTPRAFIAPSPTATMRIGTPPEIFETERHQDTSTIARSTAAVEGALEKPDPLDILTDSMSSLSLIPPAIQFGRGGKKGGFQHVRRGRGSGRGGNRRGRGKATKGES